MAEDMPRNRPPYLLRETTRHGTAVWYVRKGDGPRVRVRGDYGTQEFMAAYVAAVNGAAPQAQPKASKGTLEWLIARYRETSAWSRLSNATRRQRENIFHRTILAVGGEPFASIDKGTITQTMDGKKSTPFAARNFLETMRGLFRWAKDAQYVEADPTEGITAHRPRTEGFRPWTDAEIAQYRQRWPTGARERLALDILLFTGLRRGDAVRLGRQHIRDGIITLKTEKTGEEVTIPILPVLAASIAACPSKGLTLIAQSNGNPVTKESFGTLFREWCIAAGLSGVSAHGLRKAAATEAANNGATVAELEAIFGWRGGGMAALYTQKADRIRLSMGAIGKLARRGEEHSIPAPEIQRPVPWENINKINAKK